MDRRWGTCLAGRRLDFGFGRLAFVLAFVLAVGTIVGCGGGEEQEAAAATQARDAKLAELEKAKQALDDRRAQYAGMSELTPGADVAGQPKNQLKSEIDKAADELSANVVAFINEHAPSPGEPLSEQQTRAINIKVDEDVLLAREYIDVGGDYKRAIDILEALLPLAPDHPRLKEELAAANSNRYMRAERFATVKLGMTEAEVRTLLGPVNLRNLKEYPDQKVTAWFYRREDGGAAGVFFQEKKDGKRVYKLEFEAVKPQDAEAGGA